MTVPDFDVLFDAETAATGNVITTAYRGNLALPRVDQRPWIVANFRTSIDGTAVVRTGSTGAPRMGGPSAADRFLVAMLRASTDALMVGAGTLRADGGHRWTPGAAFPAASRALRAYRSELLGRDDNPHIVVVSGNGDVPDDHVALRAPEARTVVLTSERGAAKVLSRVDVSVSVIPLVESGPIPMAAIVAVLYERLGARVILSEAGPSTFGQLLEARCIDELFLTLSPCLAGVVREGSQGVAMTGGLRLPRDVLIDASLRSVRHAAGHLFLRYRFPADDHVSAGR